MGNMSEAGPWVVWWVLSAHASPIKAVAAQASALFYAVFFSSHPPSALVVMGSGFMFLIVTALGSLSIGIDPLARETLPPAVLETSLRGLG